MSARDDALREAARHLNELADEADATLSVLVDNRAAHSYATAVLRATAAEILALVKS